MTVGTVVAGMQQIEGLLLEERGGKSIFHFSWQPHLSSKPIPPCKLFFLFLLFLLYT
jgi:hypothetical protein